MGLLPFQTAVQTKVALFRKILYYLTGNDQPCYRWYKRCTARNISSFRAFARSPGWADTMRSAADRHIFKRSYRLFLGIDHLQLFHASFF